MEIISVSSTSIGNGSMFDLETTSDSVKSAIGRYRRLNKYEMVDTSTGKIISCNPNKFKSIYNVTKQQKHIYRIVCENFGQNSSSELLIKLGYYKMPTNIYADWKKFFPKLQRRANQKLVYIYVLVYTENKFPELHVWVKAVNNTELSLTDDDIKDCWKLGEIETAPLTSMEVVKDEASYFLRKAGTRNDIYPSNCKIYHTSKSGINKIEAELIDYAEGERRVAGCEKIFERTRVIVDEKTNKEIRRISYETYLKQKEDTDETETIDTS